MSAVPVNHLDTMAPPIAKTIQGRSLVIGLIFSVIAVGVELFRLFHTLWLDEFRLTLAGVLLLGRIFSVWNILAYAAGILLAVGLDRLDGSTLATETPHSPS